ncbi:hypothetical protein [Chelatococcus sp. HY11]|uniref:hypothetical protein n=1 Tax=Chelatococcus sp. HY11 TaxID=2835634 RepID=UPI001BCAEE00|nr:hypothetical protein [Chelatococcus sp. HY11]MBS7737765.1 hypothetical protein [Chelatococcus sp. HY11]
MQHAAIKALFQARKDGMPLRYAASMNAGLRSPRDRAIAKATGMAAGEPDLNIYLPHGNLLQIEYKTEDGELSSEQIDAHAEILELGFPPVAVVIAKDEDDAASQTMALVRQRIQDSQ